VRRCPTVNRVGRAQEVPGRGVLSYQTSAGQRAPQQWERSRDISHRPGRDAEREVAEHRRNRRGSRGDRDDHFSDARLLGREQLAETELVVVIASHDDGNVTRLPRQRYPAELW